MSDRETLDVYDKKVVDYAAMVAKGMPDADMQRFLDALPQGGTVLDWGCGIGNSSAMMRDAGFKVTATDASAEMVRYAQTEFDIAARQEAFDALEEKDAFDGIWANFSLLHEPRSAIPAHLARARLALRAGGTLHLGMKLGTGEHRDSLGRFYCYYTEEELRGLLTEAGFTTRFSRMGETPALAGGIDPFVIILADG